jgi:hypothetical protein
MMYFWLIPIVILFVALVWILYGLATKRKAAGVRTTGETLVDKTGGEGEEQAPLRPGDERGEV